MGQPSTLYEHDDAPNKYLLYSEGEIEWICVIPSSWSKYHIPGVMRTESDMSKLMCDYLDTGETVLTRFK